MINPAQLKAITDALRGGNDLETACAFASLSVAQVLKWLEAGKVEAERRAAGQKANASFNEHVKLWNELKKARADAIVRNVTYVQKAAADGSWQAAAWWLERTVPEQFSKQTAKPVQEKAPKKLEG